MKSKRKMSEISVRRLNRGCGITLTIALNRLQMSLSMQD